MVHNLSYINPIIFPTCADTRGKLHPKFSQRLAKMLPNLLIKDMKLPIPRYHSNLKRQQAKATRTQELVSRNFPQLQELTRLLVQLEQDAWLKFKENYLKIRSSNCSQGKTLISWLL